MNNPEGLFSQAQNLREQGKVLEAMDLLAQAMAIFSAEENHSRLAQCLVDYGICIQHIYQSKGNASEWAKEFKQNSDKLMELVTTKNLKEERAGAYFTQAKAEMMLSNFREATISFNKAIEHLDPKANAQKGDWKTHLGRAMYKSGDKEGGLEMMLQGLQELEENIDEIDQFQFDVWLSGAYLRLADSLRKDDQEQSYKYLSKAKEVINSNKDLVVREQQLENFEKTGTLGV